MSKEHGTAAAQRKSTIGGYAGVVKVEGDLCVPYRAGQKIEAAPPFELGELGSEHPVTVRDLSLIHI